MTLSLKEALDIKSGDRVLFDPDLTSEGIRGQVYGIPGLSTGMGLEPGRRYEVRDAHIQRGTPVRSYHIRGNYIYATIDMIPDDSINNVVFELEDRTNFGYSWFSR